MNYSCEYLNNLGVIRDIQNMCDEPSDSSFRILTSPGGICDKPPPTRSSDAAVPPEACNRPVSTCGVNVVREVDVKSISLIPNSRSLFMITPSISCINSCSGVIVALVSRSISS